MEIYMIKVIWISVAGSSFYILYPEIHYCLHLALASSHVSVVV